MFKKLKFALQRWSYRRHVKKANHGLPTIYFDMDGVLARWRSVSVEETYRKGFFLEAPVDLLVLQLVNHLISAGMDVRILSAAYNAQARKEKKLWLQNVGLGFIDVVFVPYGESKANYVTGKAILVDDYSQNLREWSQAFGHVGIKYYNGVNGSHGTWRGNWLTCTMGLGDMLNLVYNVAGYLAYYNPTRDGNIVSPTEYKAR